MNIRSVEDIDQLRFDSAGLIPIIAQHAFTGEVLMLGYANRDALSRTLESETLWFYSRSRARLWQKGETSGNTLALTSLHADCDGDALLALVHPAGPTCHTGARTCFNAPPVLPALADTIEQRIGSAHAESYTAKLLRDRNFRLKKLGEEAVELALACQSEDTVRMPEEAADLLYHMLVAARADGVQLEQILAVLSERSGPSVADR